MSTLKEHLNAKIGNSKQINESLVLSAIVCATCIGYAAGPILNTDFMKSVGSGIGSLLSGIGSLFGLGKKKEEEKKEEDDKKKEDKKKEEDDKIAELKAILKKDPDDMTGKEKEMLEKAVNNPRLQKEFSNNELKKLNKAIGVSSSDDDDESMPEGDEKKMHDILKKKPEDMTPKDKKMLKSFNDKYDLSDYLSKGELDKMSAAGISVGTNKDDDDDDFDNDELEEFVKSGQSNAILLKIAAKANEEEKDPEKKKKMDAMLDVAIASTYDENGNVLPLEEQRKKMRETVGEENWEAFSKDLDTYVDEADKADLEKFTKDIKSSYGGLSVEELNKIDENQKKRAKEASERIAKEKAEQQKIDDEIADLQKQIEEKSKDSVMKDDANPEIKELNKKIKEAQDKKAELVNNSTLGTATPSVAKNINDRDKENNGIDITAKPDKDDKKDSEPKKDDTGNDGKPNKDDKTVSEPKKDGENETKDPKKGNTTESEPNKDDKTASEPDKDDKTASEPKKDDKKDDKGDDETKKKLDDAEAKWKEREADFEKKWEKKLDDAETDADKEKVMDEYDKAKKRLKAAKNKDLDSIDDNDDHDTDKDATKKGKYKVKEEEVTDPKTGEKIKVTTYTGPRGGKFYYPDGKPKKPENKVYVHENVTYRITPFNRLRRHLLEQLNLK